MIEPVTGGVILLAAGRSTRFGSDKRAHRLADGRTLLEHSLALYASAFGAVVLVLRPDDPDPRHWLALPAAARVVIAADAHLGMGHSIAAGAAAAGAWDYAFIALADMVWVQPDTLARLRNGMAQRLQRGAAACITRPVYQGRPGHPVGFTRCHLPALQALRGDSGARDLLLTAREQVCEVPVADPGILRDADTPADL
jgi:molybdenum cofactor cytidylyltransferase